MSDQSKWNADRLVKWRKDEYVKAWSKSKTPSDHDRSKFFRSMVLQSEPLSSKEFTVRPLESPTTNYCIGATHGMACLGGSLVSVSERDIEEHLHRCHDVTWQKVVEEIRARMDTGTTSPTRGRSPKPRSRSKSPPPLPPSPPTVVSDAVRLERLEATLTSRVRQRIAKMSEIRIVTLEGAEHYEYCGEYLPCIKGGSNILLLEAQLIFAGVGFRRFRYEDTDTLHSRFDYVAPATEGEDFGSYFNPNALDGRRKNRQRYQNTTKEYLSVTVNNLDSFLRDEALNQNEGTGSGAASLLAFRDIWNASAGCAIIAGIHTSGADYGSWFPPDDKVLTVPKHPNGDDMFPHFTVVLYTKELCGDGKRRESMTESEAKDALRRVCAQPGTDVALLTDGGCWVTARCTAVDSQGTFVLQQNATCKWQVPGDARKLWAIEASIPLKITEKTYHIYVNDVTNKSTKFCTDIRSKKFFASVATTVKGTIEIKQQDGTVKTVCEFARVEPMQRKMFSKSPPCSYVVRRVVLYGEFGPFQPSIDYDFEPDVITESDDVQGDVPDEQFIYVRADGGKVFRAPASLFYDNRGLTNAVRCEKENRASRLCHGHPNYISMSDCTFLHAKSIDNVLLSEQTEQAAEERRRSDGAAALQGVEPPASAELGMVLIRDAASSYAYPADECVDNPGLQRAVRYFTPRGWHSRLCTAHPHFVTNETCDFIHWKE